MTYATPPVTIVHRSDPTRDAYGRVTQAGFTYRTPVAGAIVAPRPAPEMGGDGRSAVPVGLTVYLPPGTAVDRRDTVEVDDTVYEVDGEPAAWGNPFTGRDRGIEVALRRVTG